MVALLSYSTVKTNLYTVAPHCIGTVVVWCICLIRLFPRTIVPPGGCTDGDHDRVYHILLIAVDTSTHKAVAYLVCFLLACRAFVSSCIFHSWHTNNVTDESQHPATVGFLVGSSNCGGIPSSLSFRSNTAPKYLPALIVNALFLGVGVLMILTLGIYFRLDNRRRDREQGVHLRAKDVPTQELVGGWKDPSWRWTV